MSAVKSKVEWPCGKRFAFTIVDDTDASTVENVRAVYDFLAAQGFRITKTVWPLDPLGKPFTGGHSLENPHYRNWVATLAADGFEIALHGISDGASTRERVFEGLSRFRESIGHDPRLHANHVGQTECLYWGTERFDGIVRLIYEAGRRAGNARGRSGFEGHVEGSSYFWGDLCLERIDYVRNLVFNDINTLKMDPLMPYHDARRPYVRFWFSASDGAGVENYCRLLSEENQDRLLEEEGACVVYTHLGSTFVKDGHLNQRFVELMKRLSKMNGWFVPASQLLDYIGARRGWPNVSDNRYAMQLMQLRWLMQKLQQRKTGSLKSLVGLARD